MSTIKTNKIELHSSTESTSWGRIDAKSSGGAEFYSYSGGVWNKTFEYTYNGPLTLYGGSGGVSLDVTNGGDIRVWNGANDYSTSIWTDGIPSGSGNGNTAMTWTGSLCLKNQRTTYDRSWDNYPSITILNHTDQGPQGEFRIHGASGISGSDFSVTTRCDGGYLTGSDSRRKTNVESISNALEIVKQLDGKKFNIINSSGDLDPMRGDRKQFGLIAQECVNIIPEAVKHYEESDTQNEHGWASAYSIEYDKLTAILINAIKELNVKLDEANEKIKILEERV
jgi:hypothetical protein